MIKTILENRGESVYSAARGSGIPYTTLNELVNGKKDINECSLRTVSRISAYLNIPIESLVMEESGKSGPVISQTWENNRNKSFLFPAIAASDYFNIRRVHPLKQKLAARLASLVQSDTQISNAILFGSSVNIRCKKDSDIDIAIRINSKDLSVNSKNEISEKIQNLCGWNADIIWMDKVEEGSRLTENIKRGVILK